MEPAGLFVTDETDTAVYTPSEFTRGPWRPDAQHGGPPSTLLAHVTEPLIGDEEFLNHVEIELTKPVPLAPLRTAARREQVSGRVFRILAELHDEQAGLVARSTALVLRRAEFPTPDHVPDAPVAVSPPDPSHVVDPPRWASGDLTAYHRNAVEHRMVEGSFGVPGPAVDWQRLRLPVVVGRKPSGVERVLASADFGSGISAVYAPDSAFGLINANLSVSFIREPIGEWISVDATTHIGPSGTGLCISTIGDIDGQVAVATQSLLGYSLG